MGPVVTEAKSSAPQHSKRRSPPSVAHPLDRDLETFKEAFFADPRRRRSPAGSRTTWSGAYQPYLRRLKALALEQHSLPHSRLYYC